MLISTAWLDMTILLAAQAKRPPCFVHCFVISRQAVEINLLCVGSLSVVLARTDSIVLRPAPARGACRIGTLLCASRIGTHQDIALCRSTHQDIVLCQQDREAASGSFWRLVVPYFYVGHGALSTAVASCGFFVLPVAS